MADDLKARFLEKIEKRDGKWHWNAAVNNIGYPKMKDNGKLRLASHISLELAGREAPPPGKVVLHKNNDKSDVNPANLAVSTQQANLKQMRDQGRDRPRGVLQEPDVKSAAAPSPEILRKIHAALPRAQRFLGNNIENLSGDRLIRGVRSELRSTFPEVPFDERLRSFKAFKQTGHLQPVRNLKGRVTVIPTTDREALAKLVPSEEMVTLHSYGRDASLAKAIKDPGTRFDHPVILPGQTRPSTHGLYFYEKGVEGPIATRYTAHGEGNPARLTMQLPRSKLLHYDIKGGERAVPADVIKEYAHTAKVTPFETKQGSVRKPLPAPSVAMVQKAKSVFRKKAFSAFSEELQRLLAKN